MHVSRKLAMTIAAALVFSSSAAVAQQPQEPAPPESRARINNESGSDLLFILGALVAAALLTVLATQIGGDDADEPASP